MSQEWLIRFVEHRIGDKRIIRLMQKWLRAGVLEDGTVRVSEQGTGQGSVISPLLANIYLHYVLDLWAERWRRREATGRHDHRALCRRLSLSVSSMRTTRVASSRRCSDGFEKFALSLHPDKTRLIEFGRYAVDNRKRRGLGKPETFNFLGFTFICGKITQRQIPDQEEDAARPHEGEAQEVKEELRRRMHQPIPEQGKWLRQVVTGFFNYHAVPTNGRRWPRSATMSSNSGGDAPAPQPERRQRHGSGSRSSLTNGSPRPRILHPWPKRRFAVKHPRWEPYAGKPHVRFCAGGAQQ